MNLLFLLYLRNSELFLGEGFNITVKKTLKNRKDIGYLKLISMINF